jgi:hypothetical protein
MSNKVRQNLGISHGTCIDVSLPKRGPGVGNFCLVFYFDLPPPPSPLVFFFVKERLALPKLVRRQSLGRQSWFVVSPICGLDSW